MDHLSHELQGRLRRIPERHLSALRAALAGFEVPELAVLLGVPEEAVRPTLWLAAAKLVAALAEERGPGGPKSAPPC